MTASRSTPTLGVLLDALALSTGLTIINVDPPLGIQAGIVYQQR